jgi:hypothetical protein
MEGEGGSDGTRWSGALKHSLETKAQSSGGRTHIQPTIILIGKAAMDGSSSDLIQGRIRLKHV